MEGVVSTAHSITSEEKNQSGFRGKVGFLKIIDRMTGFEDDFQTGMSPEGGSIHSGRFIGCSLLRPVHVANYARYQK